jgi:hypothetical protein
MLADDEGVVDLGVEVVVVSVDLEMRNLGAEGVGGDGDVTTAVDAADD